MDVQEAVQLVNKLLESKGKLLIEETSRGFSLQPPIMDYLTDKFVSQICQKIVSDRVSLFNSHCLLKAQAKNYIKNAQIRFIIQPIKRQMLEEYGSLEGLENRLKEILQLLQDREIKTGYAAGNIINLLVHCLDHNPLPTITGYDFSKLPVHQSDLTHTNLHNVDFTNANLAKFLFRETFSNILSVCFSPNGEFLAAGDGSNEIHIWQVANGQKKITLKGHTDWVKSVAFDSNGTLLASASGDRTIKLWDVGTGQCIRTLDEHKDRIH